MFVKDMKVDFSNDFKFGFVFEVNCSNVCQGCEGDLFYCLSEV